MTNVKCFFHEDADGHCAGAAYKYWSEQAPEVTVDLVPINYGYDSAWLLNEAKPADKVYDNVAFVDFCPRRSDLNDLLNEGVSVEVFDHHKSSEWVCEYNCYEDEGTTMTINHDMSKAGCEVVWDCCAPTDQPVPTAVWLVGRWGMWQHEDSRVVPFHYGLEMLESDPSTTDGFEFWKACFTTLDCLPEDASLEEKAGRMQWDVVMQVINMGATVQAYKRACADSQTKSLHDMIISDHKFLMLNSKLRSNYDFPTDKVDDTYFGYGWYYWDGKAWKFSLRSDKGNDLTEVVGVSGHPGAAGFAFNDFTKIIPFVEGTHASN